MVVQLPEFSGAVDTRGAFPSGHFRCASEGGEPVGKSRSIVTVSILVIYITLGCGLPSRERLPAQETARPTSPKLPPADKTSKDAYGQCMLAARETMVRM
jgi:hypothetical protein